jgi:DNA-binding PadR family transcriptional regulator
VYLLAALAEGRQHGYALMGAVHELSGGRVELRPATLYGALERLTGEGMVRMAGEETVDGRLRRYVELTDVGAAALAEQQERLSHAARKPRLGASRRAVPVAGLLTPARCPPARCRHDRCRRDRCRQSSHRRRPVRVRECRVA